MEVVAATPSSGGVSPFHDHDVREWSRMDTLTGALERARIETDHWSANTINSSHKYGKVVDSLARTDAQGALQHAARRQLEVFHSQVPGASLQVVKTHAVSKWTTTSSSATNNVSRWTSTSASSAASAQHNPGGLTGHSDAFKNHRDFENLQLSLNRLDISPQKSKASILRSVNRRPPTRQRPKEPPPAQIDQSEALGHHITAATNLHRVSRLCHQIHETAVRQAFRRRSPRPRVAERENSESSVEIVEVETNGHTNLKRTKSSSSDDISNVNEKDANKSIEDLQDLETLQNWRRTSKIRRSLQFPKSKNSVAPSKPVDLPESSVSVRKIKEELEKGRRLNTALRNNSVDLDALDQILQSISSNSSDKTSEDIESDSSKKQKRNSFVTVESIQEVRGRLRRTSTPTSDIYKVNGNDEEPDDGIVTEESSGSDNKMPHVKSYIYGMDKKPGLGTGSLESRVKLINGNGTTRNEDWYNRRKSYGFEQVHNQEEPNRSISKNKNLVESSTDSGICRSTEIVVAAAERTGLSDELFCLDSVNQENGGLNGIQTGQVKKLASTFNQIEKVTPNTKSTTETWTKFQKSEEDWSDSKQELKSTTITIPIAKNNNTVDLTWNDEPEKDIKRHSIAVDESKYVTRTNNDSKFRRTSLVLNDHILRQDDSDNNGSRRAKKVEFCKTEVHFAADSGKVNIVATDEKPPPTQNFRRRRRNSGPSLEDFNKNGLPILHFGDISDEKSLFGVTEDSNSCIYENLPTILPTTFSLVTVNTNNGINADISEEDKKYLTDSEIKGILKNKPVKPKPYHLGETAQFSNDTSDDENRWGVRLRHIEKPDTPIWKSTVTVHNYYEQQTNDSGDHQPEFQKLLKNLKPTRKADYMSDEESRYFDLNRRSSWSISEEVNGDKQKIDGSKGYLTKINFGEGQATVVHNDRHPTWPRSENLTKDTDCQLPINNYTSFHNVTQYPERSHKNFTPIATRQSIPMTKPDLSPTEKLSSPSLVGKNNNPGPAEDEEEPHRRTYKTTIIKKLPTNTSGDGMVLRQPKKSEMTYFGVNISPKPVKKISQAVIRKEVKLSETPEVLRVYKKSPSPTRINKLKPKDKAVDASINPIYENVKNRYTRDFDSSILDELTKAADQILQAVNGYADEDHTMHTSDEEEPKKTHLETITESKSWKQETSSAKQTSTSLNKTKLRHTSSTSSIDSLNQKRNLAKTIPERQKKKVEKPETSLTKATTKARRLQRASSREALLQSHGSSSEDLPAKAEAPPVRKPRVTKKTKVTQLTMTNGLELKKLSPSSARTRRIEEAVNKEERILGSLPEIRHKTAVSTIRSTSEKTARDRLRQKNEEVRKRTTQKKETNRVTNSTNQSLEKEKSIRSTSITNKENVTQHRISTANIKKCTRH